MGHRGSGGGNQKMNWPSLFTSIPEAFTLAPSPVSFKRLELNKTSNRKLSFFQFSKTHSTKAKKKKKEREREREKERRGCCLTLAFHKHTFKIPVLKLPQIKFQEKTESLVIGLSSILQSQTEPQVPNEIKSWHETISSPSLCIHSCQWTYL